MKKWTRMLTIALLVFSILIGGCAPSIDPMEDETTDPTVVDDFSEPTTAQTTDPTEPNNKPGYLSYGFFKPPIDEKGRYVQYDGGEMQLKLKLDASGDVNVFKGTGILLFVDGHIQPYKTKDDDTYRYMHTVYPEDGIPLIIDLSFIPVSGKVGDTLEIGFSYIFYPDYSYSADGGIGFVLTGSAPAMSSRLIMEATPEELELPEVKDRVISWTVSKEPLTAQDTKGWTAQDFQTKCKSDFKVNPDDPVNQLYSYVWNISENKPIKVRFEVWGNPFVHYGLVFFLDNEVVSVDPEDQMFITVEEGYKTVVEAEIDMTGFDGEGSVYAALVPRNQFATEILTDSYIQMAHYYLLFDECPLPEAWRE